VSYPSGRSEVERLVDVDAEILVDRSNIYAANYQGAMVKLEPVRGRSLWSAELSTTVGFAQLDDSLFVADDRDRVVAISKEDGSTLWEQEALIGRRLTRPAISAGVVLVADFEGYVHVLSSTDGSLQGRVKAGSEQILELVPFDENTVVMQTRDGRLRSIRVGS